MSHRKTKIRQSKKITQSSVVKQPKVSAPDARVRKKPHYRSFRLHPIIKHPGPEMPSWYQLMKKAMRLLWANKKAILIFTLTYAVIFLVFVRGIVAPLDIDKIRDQITAYTSGTSSLSNNITIVGLMLHSAFTASGDVATIYQLLFLLSSVLALIWLFRQQQAGNTVSIKDAYYRGMYPLVPFLVIVAVIALQVLPSVIGNSLYSAVVRDGLAVTALEQVFWFLFFILLIVLSLYLVSMSLIALFIVTLPEMTPWVALKEAKLLVEHRRIAVLFNVIALLLILVSIYVAVVFPAIFISAALSQILFFLLTLLVVPFSVAYLFVLYRELL